MGNRDDALWYWRDVFGHDVKAAAVVAMAEEAGQSLEEFLAAQYDALNAETLDGGWDWEPTAEQLEIWAGQIAAEAWDDEADE